MNTILQEVGNNKDYIYIFGLGTTGESALRFFQKNKINVIAWDDNLEKQKLYPDVTFVSPENISSYSVAFIVASPGISYFFPNESSLYQQAKNLNIRIMSDIEVYMMLYPNNIYIGITGTNGKSTICHMIYSILKENNKNVISAGNIGHPILDFNNEKEKIFVLELSSYQLEIMGYQQTNCAISKYKHLDTWKANLNYSLITNFTVDHIEHHGSMDRYLKCKGQILVLNQSGKNFIREEDKDKFNKYINQNTEILDKDITNLVSYLKSNNIEFKGKADLENILFSYKICKDFLDESLVLNAIKNFKGLPHRQEFVCKINNTSFINDSKATNEEATEVALQNYSNIILILGGVLKKDNIDTILQFSNKLKKVVLIGEDQSLLSKILQNNNINFENSLNLEDAVNIAYNYSMNISTDEELSILLSPAAASFDQFANFSERGNKFKEAVAKIRNTIDD